MRLLLPILILAAGGASAAEPITGRWVTENGRAVVTVAPCGPALCGRISRILVPGQAPPDTRNPDPKLRARPMLGLPILTGFTDAGKDWRGRIYDPESGKSYKSIVARDTNGLKVRGCIAIFCQTQRWKPAG
ncbi:DUF2147 domain-containing protein [Sphingomonas sp.]|jgi:uncharacterized protein (DUF2147 family)|uniref:DUF2147 domain-containing protein n=1 Tax=Sphingomonas sp. TaxID=28214 RepID=UPI002D7F6FD2|nr:DUF2147 domain-containing protein [Sphingomonas sp.]HEU0043924.1 DUF2147 domain-containing protein [Sphingomonas sp.]